MRRRRRLVIFDWNGTLQDDVSLYFEHSVRRVFQGHGLQPPTLEEYREGIIGGAEFMEFYWRRGIPQSVTMDAIFAQSRREILAERRGADLFPEVRTVLERLLAGGCLLTVVSMAPTSELVDTLTERNLTDYFVRVDGDVHNGKHTAFTQQCGDLCERVEDAIAVGDMVDDAVAAHAAGMKSLLCPRGYHTRPRIEAARATVPTMTIIETLHGVLKHLDVT